ncbi:unnamed protein product [Paramecium primaurelia]|uniref:Transmembrane protein n=1 Tax=Paramecium primaurelia TaxID=5886 RepID=A0A8S1K3U4_PARPR|nr:unnamed protein product [Paramecium primaurelia]
MSSCNQQLGGQELCNKSVVNQKLCGYNFSNNTCESRKCEHLTYSNYSVITDKICNDWRYDCILDSLGCTTYTGNCTLIKLIHQCYQYQCFWQVGKCVNFVDCQINTTAITNYECLLENADYCRLNYTKGIGCAFYDCSSIQNQIICNQSNLVDGQNCIWINNKCNFKLCSDYPTQFDCENSYGQGWSSKIINKQFWCEHQIVKCSNNKFCIGNADFPKSHSDCNNRLFTTTISFQTDQKCIKKQQLCSDYTYKDACVSRIDGMKCHWSSNTCINICEAANFNPSTNLDCFIWHSDCMSDAVNSCQILDCNGLTTIEDCTIFIAQCFWNGANCQKILDCSNYSNSILCLDTKNSKGIPCFWDGTQCKEKTCQNKPTASSSNSDCSNWLFNCYFNINNNSCIEDCNSASTSNITHDQCESYYLSKSCTLKLDVIQCVDLPASCDLAKQTQCFLDSYGNKCYFQKSQNRCIILTCQNLESNFTSHEQCNQILNECTVNSTKNGCQKLDNCSSYLIQEQCYLDQNNIECEWIHNQNKCTFKQCSFAQLIQYSAFNCHQYFGDQCTVNKNVDGCETGQTFCRDYNYVQCISDGQMNLRGINCFWDDQKSSCLERICENGPSAASSHTECALFLSTCQKGGCREKGCFDYNYASDPACASIFEDKRCVTNGYQCVLRKACEDINIIDGCTFDINLNPCIWIDEKCYTKTCQTAQVSLTKYEDCNSYLPFCTVKLDGGCIRKQNCEDYLFQEACNTDSENFECIWDVLLNKCFSNQCIPFCGDGIVSGYDEQCDDGNYLPYDGCYKCKVHCPLGCHICDGMQCKECQKTGWQLVEGICTSECGDGYLVGNELCDDGNNIPFDGCYQCTYSCHQKCIDCFQGQCMQCETGYVEDGSLCKSVCGDGYLVEQLEQCDDGNLQNNDGCNDICEVENNWKCLTQYTISSCTYAILPYILLTKLSKTDTSIQEFKLSFSEPVSLNQQGINQEQFLQLIIIQITNHNALYDVEIKPIIAINSELSDVAYKIIVNFKSNVQNPVLQVEIKSDNIVNIFGNKLLSNKATLKFRSPYKMSADQKLLISKTSVLSKIMLYSIISISGISFAFGNLEILWNVLDMLQQLSYMKFHNIVFPENLQIYFEIFNIGSFTPIVDKLLINQKFENLFNFQTPVIQAKWKFEYYKIDCFYLQYFETFLVMLILGYIYFIISYLIYKFLIFCKYQNLPTIYQRDSLLKVVKFFFFIQTVCRKYYQYFIYSGLIRIYTSNFYEMTYASILQIVNFNSENTLNTTISYLALFTLICNIFIIFSIYCYLSSNNKVTKNISVFVQGVNHKKKQGAKQYFTILLIKKTIFIINLVVFQGLMGYQSLITACISGVFSCYFLVYQPFENHFENIKTTITEVLIMVNTLIFSVYEILQLNQNRELAEHIGWINISCFTLILISNLVIDILQQFLRYREAVIDKVKICLRMHGKEPKKQIALFF